jgi:hypothetical protein
MNAQADMSGLWSGAYRYDGDVLTVAFTAAVQETGGEIFGTTLEPATFDLQHLDEAEAEIEGTRQGQQVTFRKRYVASTAVSQPPLVYTGTANAEFTEVRGHWRFEGMFSRLRGYPTGTFIMTRVLSSQASLKEKASAFSPQY